MKYLDKGELLARLRNGKLVEQWLSADKVKDYVVLKWLWIQKQRTGEYTLGYVECFDDGNEGFTDVYAFSTLDPDEPYIENTFDDADDAIEFAISNYRASETKFVASGMIQDEYKDYLKTRL